MAVFPTRVRRASQTQPVLRRSGFDWPVCSARCLELLGDASFETRAITASSRRAPMRQDSCWLTRKSSRPRAECRSQFDLTRISVACRGGRSLRLRPDERHASRRHTRMATNRRSLPRMLIPTRREDWCLVHNGSLANPGSCGGKLEKLGERFESDCDTEERAVTCTGASTPEMTWRPHSSTAFPRLDGSSLS